MKRLSLFCSLILSTAALVNPQLSANQDISMDALLEQVKQGYHQDQQINNERLRTFKANTEQQQNLLNQLISERRKAEALSQQKESAFADNEQSITLLQQQLNDRLGALKELFGVLQISATDAQSSFYASLTQMDYPERNDVLTEFTQKMEQTVELPSIADIENLWFQMHQEVVETGKVVRYPQTVLLADGESAKIPVTRIGAFNLIGNGHYLDRLIETGQLVEFKQQPASRYMVGAAKIESAEFASNGGQVVPMTIDPLRGQLLALHGSVPGLLDRVHQGGVIGYIILGLGSIVMLIALFRLVVLFRIQHQIRQQIKHPDNPSDNPLGRIFAVYQSGKKQDTESVELRLSEAVLIEVPKINRWISFIKIAAAIAPLMGLLGTVTGMIITFQAITLFGAGDPKLMAGGISQALVTTVLGLTVAIPSLLLHNLVQSKATQINEVLEQEAVAIIAEFNESQINQAESSHAS